MLNMKVDKLNNFIINDCKENCFLGMTTIKKKDFWGNDYEIKSQEQKYVFMFEFMENRFFASEDFLIESLLEKYIKHIENGDIYEHGYPESRLIPQNHTEECEKSVYEEVVEEFNDKIKDILNQYFHNGI